MVLVTGLVDSTFEDVTRGLTASATHDPTTIVFGDFEGFFLDGSCATRKVANSAKPASLVFVVSVRFSHRLLSSER